MDPSPQLEAKQALAEAAAAAPSPWTRRASNRPLTAPARPRRAWTWWVVAASGLVVIAVVIWAAMLLEKSRATTPVAQPAASGR
jgi:hypothetical protein